MWHHEVKWDGYRVQLHKDGKHVAIYSKNGNDITRRYPVVAQALEQAPTKSFILDGELTACREDGTPDFRALLSRKDAPLRVWIFDILSQYGKDLRANHLGYRRYKLDNLMRRIETNVLAYSETFSNPHALLAACERRGLEGIVSKHMDSPYQSGPCSRWIKVKCASWREANQWRGEFFEKRK